MELTIAKDLTKSESAVLKQMLVMAGVVPEKVSYGDNDDIAVKTDRRRDSIRILDREELSTYVRMLAREVENNSRCLDKKIGSVRAKLLDNIHVQAVINKKADSIRNTVGAPDETTTVALSHDVDKIRSFEKWNVARRLSKIASHIYRVKYSEIPGELSRFITTRNRYDDLRKIMELEDKYGYRSTFYFLVGRGGRYGARYRIGDVRSVIVEMDRCGWEVGLHLNYYSWQNEQAIIKEKNAIEDVLGHSIDGCRSHYLHFDDRTMEFLQKAGFLYDASVGFADAVAFRAGIAAPYYYFMGKNGVTGRGVVEIPISYMDCAGYEEGLSNEDCKERFREMIDQYRKNAVLSFLWHSGTLDNPDYPGYGDNYRDLLNLINKSGLLVKLHRDIAKDYHQKMIAYEGNWKEKADGNQDR